MSRNDTPRPGLAAAPVPGDMGRRTVRAVRAAALSALVVLPSAAAAAAGPEDFADLADRLVPSVVNISTTQEIRGFGSGQTPAPQFPPGSPFEEFFRDFFERRGEDQPEAQPRPRTTSLGSGFIVDPSGYIVTNNHVISEAQEITVTLSDETSYTAELVGHDPKTDVALLKVNADRPLAAVSWGDSDGARVGHWVVAIGNPFGLGNTVTAGIISARARDINAGPFDDFLQTDASINRGNSGGPLFNMAGEVIGINTAIYSPSGGSVGIGFAVPANLARNVVFQLQEFGETRRGWLGVRIQTVTDDLAESLGLGGGSRGALVASVSEGSPAATAGIQVGDVILKFDDKAVETMRRLPRIVAETQIGKEVMVDLWREGTALQVGVTVGRLEEGELEMASALPPGEAPVTEEVPELGLKLSTITDDLRQEFQLGEEASGVMVVDVDAQSIAAEKGVRRGDVIVEVGQEEVSSPADVQAKIKKYREQHKNTVLLLLDRQGDLQFVAVRLLDS